MAITETAACDVCDNIILPGDVVTYITKGIFGGLNETGGTDIIGTEDSPIIHYCDDCSQEVAASLRDAFTYDEPLPDLEDFSDDDGGWGVTAAQWDEMLDRASFLNETHLARTDCRASECVYAPRIRAILAEV